MKTAEQVLATIQGEATGNSQEIRFYRVHLTGLGHEIRQGDIFLYPIEPPNLDGLKEIESRQLAPGNSKGSRHILAGKVRVFDPGSSDPLDGPIFEQIERGLLEHPEHAGDSLARGWYKVRFQLDLMAANRARRAD